jgi:hypothetical protein
MSTEPSILPGLHRVQGDFTDDAFHNLITYLHTEVPSSYRDALKKTVERLRQDIEANRSLQLDVSALISGLQRAQQQEIRALVRDLQVAFLHKRYDLLRKLHAPSPSYDYLDSLFHTYCFDTDWKVDPEIPRIVARLVVQHLTQWEVMGFIYEKLTTIDARLCRRAAQRFSLAADTTVYLGRLISFLRWIPYEWVEDILLCILHRIVYPNKNDTIRIFTTVLRTFFCRHDVSRHSLESLLDCIFDRFGATVPVSLRRHVQAVGIAAGESGLQLITRKITQGEPAYQDPFFFELLTHIDKPRAFDFLQRHRERSIAVSDVRTYVSLLANTGHYSENTLEEILSLWSDESQDTKNAVLTAIRRFHCSVSYSFLMKHILQETNITVQMRILDTLISRAPFDDAMTMPLRMCYTKVPILYYYTIDLCHRRMVNDALALRDFKHFETIYHFEKARREIYTMYLCLTNFIDLLHMLYRVFTWARDNDVDGYIRLTGEFGIGWAADRDTGSLDSTKRRTLETSMARVDTLARVHARYAQWFAPVSAILAHCSDLTPEYSDDIFGREEYRYYSSRMLYQEELERITVQHSMHACIETVKNRLHKARDSVRFIRDYFLFKEWFVRKAPFLLHEELPGFIEAIREAKQLPFDEQALLDIEYQRYLRNVFEIFKDCTQHGVYLTDLILTCLQQYPAENRAVHINEDLTHRRSRIARGEIEYNPYCGLDRHLVFTTFAHIYRYGKEAPGHPSITYLWLRFLEYSDALKRHLDRGSWPRLPLHPDMHSYIGPCIEKQYQAHYTQALQLRDMILQVYERVRAHNISMRVIPNITYGLFCLAPIMNDLLSRGIHISLAGISSRMCDDENIHEYAVHTRQLYPVKTSLFSTASNYGTLNYDRILIVIDGTMEPVDRQSPDKIRLPKAHRGYLNHLVAINYVRARYGYSMHNPAQQVASALRMSERYVRNLVSTEAFKTVENTLRQSLDVQELDAFHQSRHTGRTYYRFAQWNPEGRDAYSGTRGFGRRLIPWCRPEDLHPPAMLFVCMNRYSREGDIPSFFDNNPEVEKARIVLTRTGVRLDTGWPAQEEGLEIHFPEGENK